MTEELLTEVKLKNVRTAFSSLFRRGTYQGEETKYGATLLMPKDHPQAAAVWDAYKNAAKKAWKGKADNVLKTVENNTQKSAIVDGDLKDHLDGHAGNWVIVGKNDKRFPVLDRDTSLLSEEDEAIRDGYNVNAIISFWAQDNNYGKGIRCELRGVMLHSENDTFGAGRVASVDEFADMRIEDDEDVA